MRRYEFKVETRPEVEVRIERGRIEIQPGQSGQIVVEVDEPDEAVTVDQKGGTVVIATDPSQRRLTRRVFVVITVPEGTDATIATATAKVDCQTPLGVGRVKTTSGDVEVARARELDVRTASGDIRIGSVTEGLRVATASGDARAKRCSGLVNFSSASGDIRIDHADCSLTAATASGDVNVARFTGPTLSLNLISGSARLGIPAGTTVELDVTTLSGQVILPEPAGEPAANPDRHTSIKAKLVSGDLEIGRV